MRRKAGRQRLHRLEATSVALRSRPNVHCPSSNCPRVRFQGPHFRTPHYGRSGRTPRKAERPADRLSPARRTPKRKIIHREKNIVYFPTGRKVVPLQCVQAQRCRHRKWLFYDRPDNGKQRLYFCNEPKQPIERSHISIYSIVGPTTTEMRPGF